MKIMFIVNNLGVNEPFGPMILSAVLNQRGHKTTLAVLQRGDVQKRIFSWKPDILAYSMMSVDMKDMKRFNDSLREKIRIFTLLGGIHATLDRSCINDRGIDAICVGEGEGPIVDVVERLDKGKDLRGIPNILTSQEEHLNLRNLIEDLDTVPFMDRELVYSYPEMARFGIKGIWTSRGCIFPCPYCFNNRYNEVFENKGKIIRRRSVDSIIRETKELTSNYRVAFIRLQDDAFAYKVDDWLKEFAERWPQEIGIPFYGSLRAEFITDEMVFYLKKAGCFSVSISIEAADDDVRTKMLRRKVSKQKLEDVFKTFKRHKINVYTNTMFGLPFTSLEHDINSLDFSIKVQPEMADFTIFMPYPGTDLGDYCAYVGIYDPDRGPIDYGMKYFSPLACFSRKEKEIQHNLCKLAICAVKFPWLRNLIIKHLIYWKPNSLFFLIHYFLAVMSYGRKIFYFKHTFLEYVELIVRTLKHHLYDFTRKEKIDKSDIKDKSKNRVSKIFDYKTKPIELKKCMEAMESCDVYSLQKGL